MADTYLVYVKASDGRDMADRLQVCADTADEAVEAVRAAVGSNPIVEVDREPLSTNRAIDAGVITGKVLLS